MKAGDESDPGFREVEIIGAMENQALAGTVRFSCQAPIVGHLGNEPGDVRVHPIGSRQGAPHLHQGLFMFGDGAVRWGVLDRFGRLIKKTGGR
jgi:hypothetical protein